MAMEGLGSKGGDVPVDKLSELPDSLLSDILSLLPAIEEVVRTSILSKRWKNLWTYVPTLVFQEPEFWVSSKKMQFSQFVNRVLHCHRGGMKKMKIVSEYFTDNDYDIRNWTSYAIDRGVEIFDLKFPSRFRCPFCLFRSQTLVDLRLDVVGTTNLNIPSAPFFPSLKKLRFVISKHNFESLQLLISGCAVLEELSIVMIFIPELSMIFSSSTLKRLQILHSFRFRNVNHNVYLKIELDVPTLEFLRVFAPPTVFIVKDHLSSLTEVDIEISSARTGAIEDICYHSLVELMEQISNVKVLHLDCDFKKPLIYVMNAKFPNLTELEITSSFFEWPLLASFMESAINLECISLTGGDSDKENRVYWIDPHDVPYCLRSSVRKMFIRGSTIENALDIVDYVLRNAELLERMDLEILCFDENRKAQCEIAQCEILLRLVMIKRASRVCEISFV